jgi:hypothetical protein
MMIWCLENAGELSLAERYFESYVQASGDIDSQLLSTIIRIHAKQDNVAGVYQDFEKFTHLALSPLAIDYENLIRVLANSNGKKCCTKHDPFEYLRKVSPRSICES